MKPRFYDRFQRATSRVILWSVLLTSILAGLISVVALWLINPLDPQWQTILLWVALLGFLLSVGLGLLLSSWFAKRNLRALQPLTQVTEALVDRLKSWQQGDLSLPIPDADFSEWEPLKRELEDTLAVFQRFSFEEYKPSASAVQQLDISLPHGIVTMETFESHARTYFSTYGQYYRNALVLFRLAEIQEINETDRSAFFAFFSKAISLYFPKGLVAETKEGAILLLLKQTSSASVVEHNLRQLTTQTMKLSYRDGSERLVTLQSYACFTPRDGTRYEDLLDRLSKRTLPDHPPLVAPKPTTELLIPQREKRNLLFHAVERMCQTYAALSSVEEFNTQMNEMLHLIQQALGVSHVGVVLQSKGEEDPKLAFHFPPQGEHESNVPSFFSQADLTQYEPFFDGMGSLYCNDVASLPPFMKNYANNLGLTAFFHQRIRPFGKTVGYLYFHETRPNRLWSEDELQIIALLAKVLGAYISIKLEYDARMEEKQRLDLSLSALGAYLYTLELPSRTFVEFSDNFQAAFPMLKPGDPVLRNLWDDKEKLPNKNEKHSYAEVFAHDRLEFPGMEGIYRRQILRVDTHGDRRLVMVLLRPLMEEVVKPSTASAKVAPSKVQSRLPLESETILFRKLEPRFASRKESGYFLLVDSVKLDWKEESPIIDTILATTMQRIHSLGFVSSLFFFQNHMFLIHMPGATANAASEAATRLLELLRKSMKVDGKEKRLNFNIVTVSYPRIVNQIAALESTLLQAKEAARAQGMNLVFDYEGDEKANQARREKVLSLLTRAIETTRLELHFQPIYNIMTKRYEAVEGLVRLPFEGGGYISPAEFLPLAEAKGLLPAMGRAVLRKAAEFYQQHGKNLFPLPNARPISLNLSYLELVDPQFENDVTSILAEYQVPSSAIRFEITEAIVAKNFDLVSGIVTRLQQKGFAFAIDDFGTEYSSLNLLEKIPVDLVKIDRAFVIDIENNNRSLVTLYYIFDVAKQLKRQVIAEGIETKAQFELIRELNCEGAQGYYFGKPMPVKDLIAFLNQPISTRK